MSVHHQPEPALTDIDSFADRPVTSALSGLLYAAFVIAVSVGMLLLNALFCLTVYSSIPEYADEEIMDRVGQFFYFVAPVALMVVEWHLIDRIRRLLRSSAD